jgi:ATP-dependent helicase HrpA
MEERLRTRGLLHGAETFVEFYDRALPRQVSSGASLEHFTRHLSDAGRQALSLGPAQIFARLPEPAELAQFPEVVSVDSLAVPVEYRFAPGESRDGASLRIPLLALPGIERAQIDAAVPGLAEPRIEALLRSLPKDARRHLIPIGETAVQFLESAREAAENGAVPADLDALKTWLKARRGIPDSMLRFDLAALPGHLRPQLTVTVGGKDLAHGDTPAELRRAGAAAARAELDRRARELYGTTAAWQRFEWPELPDKTALALEQGSVWVFPTLAQNKQRLEVRFEWSAAEAERGWRQGAVHLARGMLAPQARDLAKNIAGNTTLLLAASPYMQGAALREWLLQLAFRRACFGDAPAPRTRAEFEAALDRGRARLYPCLEEAAADALHWFDEARGVRRAIGAANLAHLADAAEESDEHVRNLLDTGRLANLTDSRLQQLPRYFKAEQRRWQRNAARGSEPHHIVRELREWSGRHARLALAVGAELRWIPQLDELLDWLEEYRVSLYAQELKTQGPVSAARLQQRAAAIESWLAR